MIMASGACDVKKWDLDKGYTNEYPRKKISLSAKQKMKEDNFSLEQLVSEGNGTLVGQPSNSNQQLHKGVVCKRKAQHQTPSPYSRRKQHPRGWGCDMANKENELAAGNLHEKLQNDRHTFVLNSSDSGSSHTEGASSQYSSFFAELSKDHETMTQVLFSRNLRLNVALTFWRKRSVNELITYLVRIQDLGVMADCLPVLTNSLQEDKTLLSAGCCVDLLPLVQYLLKSKFEEYVIVGLNWLQAVVKRWCTPQSTLENPSDENVRVLKHHLSGLWQQESHLASVPGYTGNIAKDLDGYLSQLH